MRTFCIVVLTLAALFALIAEGVYFTMKCSALFPKTAREKEDTA